MASVYSMQAEISRHNLSHHVVDRIRELTLSGSLEPGERLNEVRLASQLGISRTPLREALSRLVVEGALFVSPGRGFFVSPLSEAEVREIYPIRAILDPAALRLSGIPSRASIGRLKALNQKFVKSTDALNAVEIDDAWHLELLSGCPNKTLVELIQQFMRRTRRYELGLMRSRRSVITSGADHDFIIESLEAGHLEGACAALERNMESGEQPILAWLKSRERNAAA